MLHYVGLGLQIIGALITLAALVLQLRSARGRPARPVLSSPRLIDQLDRPLDGPPSTLPVHNGVSAEIYAAFEDQREALNEIADDLVETVDTYLGQFESERRETRRLVLMQMVGVVLAILGTPLA